MLGKVSGCGAETDERNHACHYLLCPRWERPSQELGYALITLHPDHFLGLSLQQASWRKEVTCPLDKVEAHYKGSRFSRLSVAFL